MIILIPVLLDKAGVRDLIAAQSLFSVYVHPGVSYRFPNESLFYGRETELLVDTRQAWSTFMIVEGELALLASALKDPNNQYVIFAASLGDAYVSVENLCCSLTPVFLFIHRRSFMLS